MARLMRTRRRVLREGITGDYVEEFADSRGWERAASVPRDIVSATDHHIQWRIDDELTFDYLESYLTNDGCFLALGHDETKTERFMREAESVFELVIYSEGDLLDNIEAASDAIDLAGLGKALIRAGLGAPLRYGREFFGLIVGNATSYPDHRIRQFAICSMVYAEWPEFVPILRNIITSDREESVRDRAQIVLNAYIAAGVGEES